MSKEKKLKSQGMGGLDALFGDIMEEETRPIQKAPAAKKTKSPPRKRKPASKKPSPTGNMMAFDLGAAARKKKEYINLRMEKSLHLRLARIAKLENLKSGPSLGFSILEQFCTYYEEKNDVQV